jgi:tetratricopeptide (TPR) repeat protein
MLTKLHYLSYLLVLLWLTGCSQPTPIATSVAPIPTLMPTPTLTLTPTLTPAVSATATIPRETQDFYDMGLVYYLAGAFEEAIASLSQAIALTPDYAQAYLYRGLAYQEEGQLEQAQSDFQQVLALSTNPDDLTQARAGLQKLAGRVQIAGTPQPEPTKEPRPTVLIPAQPPVEAQLDQPLTLYFNQGASLPDEDLLVTFLDVLEDSRCPTQVECAWSGQAIILIQVQLSGLTPVNYELNDNPPLKEDTVSYEKYNIKFVKLDPYPEQPRVPIPPASYVATLLVTSN